MRATTLGNGLTAATDFDLAGRVAQLSTLGVLVRRYVYDAARGNSRRLYRRLAAAQVELIGLAAASVAR